MWGERIACGVQSIRSDIFVFTGTGEIGEKSFLISNKATSQESVTKSKDVHR